MEVMQITMMQSKSSMSNLQFYLIYLFFLQKQGKKTLIEWFGTRHLIFQIFSQCTCLKYLILRQECLSIDSHFHFLQIFVIFQSLGVFCFCFCLFLLYFSSHFTLLFSLFPGRLSPTINSTQSLLSLIKVNQHNPPILHYKCTLG